MWKRGHSRRSGTRTEGFPSDSVSGFTGEGKWMVGSGVREAPDPLLPEFLPPKVHV